MKTIIAGSRNITDYLLVEEACKQCGWKITEVICGLAKGVDLLGEQWAKIHGIPVSYFPAEWGRYGKSAGYKRNLLMAEQAKACIIVWDGTSKGTASMIRIAEKKGLKLYRVMV